MKIGEKIRYRRQELGLTQEEVCSGICSITYLSKLENNKLESNKDILKLLSNRLEIDISELYRDDLKEQMSVLKNLYKIITSREINKAEEQINKYSHYKIVNDPKVKVAFEIIILELYIIKMDKNNSLILLKSISQLKQYLTDETKIWYYKTLGFFEYTFGDINKSLYLLSKAEELLEKVNKKEPHLDYLLGLVYTRLMLISKSILHTEKALALYNQEINFKRIVDCKLLLGINYNRIGKYKMAESYFLNLVKSLKNTDDNETLGKLYHNLGYLYSLKNNYMKSISYLNKAINQKEEKDKPSTLYLLSYEYKKIGEVNNALKFCNIGLSLAKNDNPHFYYKLYILKNFLEHKEIDDNFIIKLKNEIIPFFYKSNPPVAIECYYLLAKIFSNKNKYKLASMYYEKAIDLEFKIKRRELLF